MLLIIAGWLLDDWCLFNWIWFCIPWPRNGLQMSTLAVYDWCHRCFQSCSKAKCPASNSWASWRHDLCETWFILVHWNFGWRWVEFFGIFWHLLQYRYVLSMGDVCSQQKKNCQFECTSLASPHKTFRCFSFSRCWAAGQNGSGFKFVINPLKNRLRGDSLEETDDDAGDIGKMMAEQCDICILYMCGILIFIKNILYCLISEIRRLWKWACQGTPSFGLMAVPMTRRLRQRGWGESGRWHNCCRGWVLGRWFGASGKPPAEPVGLVPRPGRVQSVPSHFALRFVMFVPTGYVFLWLLVLL